MSGAAIVLLPGVTRQRAEPQRSSGLRHLPVARAEVNHQPGKGGLYPRRTRTWRMNTGVSGRSLELRGSAVMRRTSSVGVQVPKIE